MNALKAKLLTCALNPIFWRELMEGKLTLITLVVRLAVQKDKVIYGKKNTKTNNIGIIGIADIFANRLFFYYQ